MRFILHLRLTHCRARSDITPYPHVAKGSGYFLFGWT